MLDRPGSESGKQEREVEAGLSQVDGTGGLDQVTAQIAHPAQGCLPRERQLLPPGQQLLPPRGIAGRR